MNQRSDGVGRRGKTAKVCTRLCCARALWDDPDSVRLLGVTRITADGSDLAIATFGYLRSAATLQRGLRSACCHWLLHPCSEPDGPMLAIREAMHEGR